MAHGRIARSTSQQQETLVETRVDCRKRQQLHSDGSELDRQRSSLESDTDVLDVDRVVLGQGDIRLCRPSALNEQDDGRPAIGR
jgi:hypothetical protein